MIQLFGLALRQLLRGRSQEVANLMEQVARGLRNASTTELVERRFLELLEHLVLAIGTEIVDDREDVARRYLRRFRLQCQRVTGPRETAQLEQHADLALARTR